MEVNMKCRILSSAVLVLWSATALAVPSKAEMSYKKDVYPILHDYCLNCHQPGGKGYERNGLDMSTYKTLMKGTKFGSVINPGNSFTSIMIQAVEGRVHASIKMPYGMSGGLAKDKIEILKEWVDQGAKDN
jgi:hypothetical protein